MDKRKVDIVLVRMDKIGDLVVSLPVDAHPALGGSQVTWFISRGLGFITDQAAPRRTAVEFSRPFSPLEFYRMYQWLKAEKPQTIVLLHNPWWVSMAAWLAKVPERIGRLSQWHSFLFLNLPIRQKRSSSSQHESDYNFDLLEHGVIRLGLRRTDLLSAVKKTYLRLLPPNPFATLAAHGLKSRGYRVVHPGMAGSALNWPQKHFYSLIETLAQELPVVITGTAADKRYLETLKDLQSRPNIHWLVGSLSTSDLLNLLAEARSVTGPSTGVLHLAAALGTPTIGIYSPRKVEHPRRWGPKGLYTSCLLPEVSETELIQPRVMEQISPERVCTAIHTLEAKNVAAFADSFTPRI